MFIVDQIYHKCKRTSLIDSKLGNFHYFSYFHLLDLIIFISGEYCSAMKST